MYRGDLCAFVHIRSFVLWRSKWKLKKKKQKKIIKIKKKKMLCESTENGISFNARNYFINNHDNFWKHYKVNYILCTFFIVVIHALYFWINTFFFNFTTHQIEIIMLLNIVRNIFLQRKPKTTCQTNNIVTIMHKFL